MIFPGPCFPPKSPQRGEGHFFLHCQTMANLFHSGNKRQYKLCPKSVSNFQHQLVEAEKLFKKSHHFCLIPLALSVFSCTIFFCNAVHVTAVGPRAIAAAAGRETRTWGVDVSFPIGAVREGEQPVNTIANNSWSGLELTTRPTLLVLTFHNHTSRPADESWAVAGLLLTAISLCSVVCFAEEDHGERRELQRRTPMMRRTDLRYIPLEDAADSVRNVAWKSEEGSRRSKIYLREQHGVSDSKPWMDWDFPPSAADQEGAWRDLLERVCYETDDAVRQSLDKAPFETIEHCHDGDGYRPTHHAAAMGKIAVLEMLLNKGFAVDGENFFDKNIDIWTEVTEVMTAQVTPLHLAARHGHELAVDLLLARGADVNKLARTGNRDLRGKVTAIQLAAAGGHLEIAHKLFSAGANVEDDGRYGSAVSLGGVGFARHLVDRGVNFEYTTLSLMLMRLVNPLGAGNPDLQKRRLANMQAMLEFMAELRMAPSATVLMAVFRDWRASTRTVMEATRLLILHGTPCANNTTVLMSAAFKGEKALVQYMLQLGWNAGAGLDRTGRAISGKLGRDIGLLSRLRQAASGVNIPRLSELRTVLAEAEGHPPTLQQWCRWMILQQLCGPHRVDALPISKPMKDFVLLRDVPIVTEEESWRCMPAIIAKSQTHQATKDPKRIV